MNATPLAPVAAYHREESEKAVQIYVASLSPAPLAQEWQNVCALVRNEIMHTLEDTKSLRDLEASLTTTGKHLLVLRALFAPPISQDQLKLVVPSYPKGAEKKGSKLSKQSAADFAAAFRDRRDKGLTRWLDGNSDPSPEQVSRLLNTLTPMISSQIFNTVRRNRLCDEQEKAVESLLTSKGWMKESSAALNTPADLAPKHFMRKTRCKTRTATKEVDIACGVNAGLILAMECKVTNDGTNSVKRIGDVMNKVKAWNDQWAGFIQTAALLQGVIKYGTVAEMLDAGVEVFWSHDLQRLADWLDARA